MRRAAIVSGLAALAVAAIATGPLRPAIERRYWHREALRTRDVQRILTALGRLDGLGEPGREDLRQLLRVAPGDLEMTTRRIPRPQPAFSLSPAIETGAAAGPALPWRVRLGEPVDVEVRARNRSSRRLLLGWMLWMNQLIAATRLGGGEWRDRGLLGPDGRPVGVEVVWLVLEPGETLVLQEPGPSFDVAAGGKPPEGVDLRIVLRLANEALARDVTLPHVPVYDPAFVVWTTEQHVEVEPRARETIGFARFRAGGARPETRSPRGSVPSRARRSSISAQPPR